MAGGSPKSDGANDWVSPKRRQRPPPMSAIQVEVGRDGGAIKSLGTFGKAERFGKKIKVGYGVHSPEGAHFYCRNQLYKLASEVGKEPTQGIGGRSSIMGACSSPPAVGPGAYEIVESAKAAKSPLDGPEYCTLTIKVKLGSSLVPKNMCSPGPHAKYEVRKDLDTYLPTYSKPKLEHGGRHAHCEDSDGPGPGGYDQFHRTLAHSTTVPSFRTGAFEVDAEQSRKMGCRPAPRFGTFGTGERFNAKNTTHSPDGKMYYVHSKILMGEDYMAHSRTCGMGAGSKTDFANPQKLSRSQRTQVSPVTYFPVSSMAKKTSAIDGFATRCTSPIYAGTKGLGAQKRIPTVVAGDSPSKSMMARAMSEPTLEATTAEGADAGGTGGPDAAGNGS